MEPAQEVPGGFLDGGPETIAGEPLVVPQKRRQDVVLDLLARCRSTSVDEVHDIRVAIEVDQIVDVVVGEPPQHQPVGLQEDVHRPRMSWRWPARPASPYRRAAPWVDRA